jgi:uncharacterized membrane protein YedE/YeeE
MAMPTGDSPEKAQAYYQYLQSRQLAPHGRTVTWHVDWTALAWMWGFVVVLAIIFGFWIRDYRSTHPQTGISPLDRWGGYATEAAGRVPVFFWLATVAIVAFGAAFVIDHLISGQLF